MVVLLGVGFVAGLVTALSPCVLPVLPIVLAGGASGRKPLRIIAGLIGSFTVFTLGAAWLLSASQSAHATPSTTYWTPATSDIQAFNVWWIVLTLCFSQEIETTEHTLKIFRVQG